MKIPVIITGCFSDIVTLLARSQVISHTSVTLRWLFHAFYPTYPNSHLVLCHYTRTSEQVGCWMLLNQFDNIFILSHEFMIMILSWNYAILVLAINLVNLWLRYFSANICEELRCPSCYHLIGIRKDICTINYTPCITRYYNQNTLCDRSRILRVFYFT